MSSPFRVSYSEAVRAELRSLLEEALRRDAAFGRRALDAARRLDERLRAEARTLGEPSFPLPHLRLDVRLAVLAPLSVTFAVHQDLPVVFVQRFRLLAAPGES